MGCDFEFRCPACGYEAEVSGGPDCGMACATETILCKTCGEIRDVVTHSPDLGNFPPRESEDGSSTAAPLRCPEGQAHDVVRWSRQWPCPKCGESMKQGDPTVLWD